MSAIGWLCSVQASLSQNYLRDVRDMKRYESELCLAHRDEII